MDDLDELHLEADRLFGPCNDPGCPGSRQQAAPGLRRHLQLVRDAESASGEDCGGELGP